VTTLRAGSATDVGKVRTSNQDQLLVTADLFAVADGMGGHAAGEVASLAAVEALRATFHQPDGTQGLITAAEAANRSIWDRAQDNPELRGMGTTLVAVALVSEDDEDRLAIVNVGDSRVYLLRDGELEQLTTDHSLVQELVDDGQLSELEATVHPQRHVLTRALGVDADVSVDCLQLLPLKGDRLLLCSDGLSRELTDDQVASVLRRLADPDDAARQLVTAARTRGGNDNITVVVIDVVDDDDRAVVASEALRSDPGLSIPSPLPPIGDGENVAGPGAGGSGRNRPFGQSAAPAPRSRAITVRVVGFVILLLLLLGGAAFAVAWYARGSYFVGLNNAEVTIYRGRPGGLLWFEPTVLERTGVRSADVPSYRLADLQSGKEEASLADARLYVQRLKDQAPGSTTATTATSTATSTGLPAGSVTTASPGTPTTTHP
jgi:serine/threonine protein phosphatase PrpC